MTTKNHKITLFKIKNRQGYAAVCDGCLTEGSTKNQAYDRMIKALRRIFKKNKVKG